MGSGGVLVIGPDVEDQMARFRNFEETGWVDRHVISIDVLTRDREIWTRRWAEQEDWYVQDTEGRLREVFEKTSSGKYLYVVVTTDPHRPQPIDQEVFGHGDYADTTVERPRVVLELPQDHKVVKAKLKEFMSFAQWLTKYHGIRAVPEGAVPELEGANQGGWMRLDQHGEVIEVIERTIPGGFWFPHWSVLAHAWKLKPGALGERTEYKPNEQTGFAGSVLKCDIDFDGMRFQVAMKAGACWDKARETPSAFENILISGEYYQQYIHLPREQYIKIIQDINLWNCSLIMDGKHIECPPPEFQPSCDDVLASILPWHAYLNQLVDSLLDDTLMTMVGYRC